MMHLHWTCCVLRRRPRRHGSIEKSVVIQMIEMNDRVSSVVFLLKGCMYRESNDRQHDGSQVTVAAVVDDVLIGAAEAAVPLSDAKPTGVDAD